MKALMLTFVIAMTYLILVTSSIDYYFAASELESNKKLWEKQNIKFYEAKVKRNCRCIQGPFNIKVVNDVIESCDSSEVDCQSLPTVQSLFQSIQDAIDEEYDEISVIYDNELGYPKDVFLDYVIYNIQFKIIDKLFRKKVWQTKNLILNLKC